LGSNTEKRTQIEAGAKIGKARKKQQALKTTNIDKKMIFCGHNARKKSQKKGLDEKKKTF